MTVSEPILSIIKAKMFCPCPINGESNFYTDLGFDSLTFAGLIVEVENTFSISFTIPEMQQCSFVGELIFMAEKKLEEMQQCSYVGELIFMAEKKLEERDNRNA